MLFTLVNPGVCVHLGVDKGLNTDYLSRQLVQ